MNRVWQFLVNKFGRLVSALGILLSGIETFDISPIKDPLEQLFGHRVVLGITLGLFLASYIRHQYVASLHPATAPLPPPQTQATR